MCKSLLVFHCNYVSCTVHEIFSVKEWHDVKSWATGRSKSLKMVKIRKLGHGFLFEFRSNYGSILHNFRDKVRYCSPVLYRNSLIDHKSVW